MKFKFVFISLLIFLSFGSLRTNAGEPVWEIFDSLRVGLPDNFIYSMDWDGENTMLVGSAFGFTFFENESTCLTFNTSVREDEPNRVNCIIDAGDSIVLGTRLDGMITFRSGLMKYDTVNSPLPSNNVLSLAINRKKTHIGCDAGWVVVDSTVWNVFDAYNGSLPSYRIQAFEISDDSFLWVGTDAGLACMEIFDKTHFKLPSSNVQALEFDDAGNLWVGTDAGLTVFNLISKTWRPIDYQNDYFPFEDVRSIMCDVGGEMWIGCEEGLAWFVGDTCVTFTTDNSDIPANTVSCLESYELGSIWAGTVGGGLAKLYPRGKVRPIRIKFDSAPCAGGDLKLIAENGPDGQYYWTGPNGFESYDKEPVIANADESNEGKYILRIESADSTFLDSVLVELAPKPSVKIIGAETPVCEGGAAFLRTDKVFAEYRWSNGSTAQSIFPESEGEYSIEVVDENGCVARDTVLLEFIDPKINVRDVFFGSLCAGREGFNLLRIENQSEFFVELTNFKIEPLDAFDFVGNLPDTISLRPQSDTLVTIRFSAVETGVKSGTARFTVFSPCAGDRVVGLRGEAFENEVIISLPDTVVDLARGDVSLPVVAEYPCFDGSAISASYDLDVRIMSDVFYPITVTNDALRSIKKFVSSSGRPYAVLSLKGEDLIIARERVEMSDIIGTVMLGEYDSTALEIKANSAEISKINGESVKARVKNGSLKVFEICEKSRRLVDSFYPTSVEVFPNPARDVLYVEVGGELPGTYKLSLYSAVGVEFFITTFYRGESTESEIFEIDLTEIPSGLFILSLQDPVGKNLRVSVTVVK